METQNQNCSRRSLSGDRWINSQFEFIWKPSSRCSRSVCREIVTIPSRRVANSPCQPMQNKWQLYLWMKISSDIHSFCPLYGSALYRNVCSTWDAVEAMQTMLYWLWTNLCSRIEAICTCWLKGELSIIFSFSWNPFRRPTKILSHCKRFRSLRC